MDCSFLEFIWIWDQTQNLTLPHHHKQMAAFLTGLYQQRQNGLLMAFRNSGKSTVVGLFGAWLLLQNPNLRLMILSADHELAKKMAHHIKQIIERHPLTRFLKPTHSDEWASNRFTVCRTKKMRDPSVLACGLMANTTGCRADIIICDDVEVPKTCDTAAKRESLRRKLSELDYILTPKGFILYIGTPHTADTLYQVQAGGFLENWPVLKIPLIQADGTSAWPERFSSEQIDQLRHRSGNNKFLSQMMLQPLSVQDSRLDVQRLKFYTGELDYREANGRATLSLNGIQMKGVACWWDPAFGSPKGDKSVVACVFFDDCGNSYLHRLLYLSVPPDTEATAYQCAAVRSLVQECFIPAVHLETNGIGRFLPALLRQEFARSRTPCTVLEETSRQNKVVRILSALDAPLMNGSLWVHNSVKATPFLSEVRDFSPAGNTHDDGLDALAGCLLSAPTHLSGTHNSFVQHNLDWRF